ncbi:FAD-dependent monooxygenase [Nocardia huaxiensis]|uniref:FAD-dependent monooxygenase n=1 Tax=Nocardia huaxiensis TaxID=2755382 RepID=A0A7D6ZI44_9NOCA|nr:FAD-dependent monooxygenase [Nocardia huaxiensis]QLY28463.1 FAD-dependent monooxygenase [Nocardia huaxiensis]
MTVDVVINGAGPAGLMLACELSLAGVRPLVLERLAAPSAEPKANGLLGQVVQLVDRRGLYASLSGSAVAPQPNSTYFMFAAMALDLSLLEDSPIYGLAAPQHHITRVLEERAVELGAQIRRGHEVLGLAQDDDAVTVEVAGPDGTYRLRAGYLVGADGAHSLTRKLSGIEFPGVSYDRTTGRAAHATIPSDWVDPATGALTVPGYGTIQPFLPLRTERGGFSYAPFPGQPPLISTTEWDQPDTDVPMSLDELQASVGRVLAAELPLDPPSGQGPHVLRRLRGGNTRIADRFRDRRVFLIGDAAHIYTAGGGPGLNLGLQDAANLGWKLAAAILGNAPAGLLDSYETERRQAASRMVTYAQAQSALIAPGSDVTALRTLFTELLLDQDTVQRLAALTAGADIRYDMGGPETHPLIGRFAPDMDLLTPNGPLRLAELTRTARPLLLDLTADTSLAEAFPEWHDHLDIVAAHPQPGSPAALLLRPDCYVAWATASPHPDAADRQALHAALHRWLRPTDPAHP